VLPRWIRTNLLPVLWKSRQIEIKTQILHRLQEFDSSRSRELGNPQQTLAPWIDTESDTNYHTRPLAAMIGNVRHTHKHSPDSRKKNERDEENWFLFFHSLGLTLSFTIGGIYAHPTSARRPTHTYSLLTHAPPRDIFHRGATVG
jgi:hypothetical protein